MSRQQCEVQKCFLNDTVRVSSSVAMAESEAGSIAVAAVRRVRVKASARLRWLLCFALLSPMLLVAQGGSGSIQGTIKDPSGAVLPGATVTIRNMDTNVIRTTVTESSGFFSVPALVAGNYEVKATHDGFSTVAQTGIVLVVSQEQVVNFALPIGATNQVVEVNTMGSVINTTDNTIGGLVSEHAIADLPLNGRNYNDLALMEPGVEQDYSVGGTGGAGAVTFSSYGSTPWSNLFTLDGAILNNALATSASSQTGNTLGIDGLQEFKVIGIPDTSYGLVMGGQVVMASKGGTNGFHGDVYEYLRNSIFDARSYFDTYHTLPPNHRIEHFERNQYGATIGGPIRRDKTFFFLTYESLKSSQGGNNGNPPLNTVPAPGCIGPAGTVLWNGIGTMPSGYNTLQGICAQLGGATSTTATVSAATAPLLALYPATGPNVPGGYYYSYSTQTKIKEDYGQARIDHTISGTDSLFARYTNDDGFINIPQAFPEFRQDYPGGSQFLTIGETHLFSASALNSARISVSRSTEQVNNIFTGSNNSSNPAYIGSQYSFVPGLPMGSFSGLNLNASGSAAGLNNITGFGQPTQKPSLDNLTLYTFQDDFSYTKGKNTAKAGTLLNLYRQAGGTNGNANGQLVFTSFIGFLQGAVQTATALSVPAGIPLQSYAPNVNRYFGYSTYGFYFQDAYRLTPRVTLNGGLRYEFMNTVNELNGNGYALVNFATATGPTKGPIMSNPTLKNFAPRVGFAWDVLGNAKMSLRGGFGIYRDIGNLGSELREQLQGTPPYGITTVTNINLNTIGGVGNTFLQNGTVGKSLQIVGYEEKAPYSEEFNLTFERQIFGMGVSLTYVGNRGIHLWTRTEGNPTIPLGYNNGVPFYTSATTQPASYFTYIPAGQTTTCPNGQAGFCRLNPNYSTNSEDHTVGAAWYNSGQVNVVKQAGHGIEYQASYTWSRSLDDTQNMGGFESGSCTVGEASQAPRLDWGPSCFDATNKFNVNMIYRVPSFKTNNFASSLANGWYVSNIVTIQSGLPFSPLITGNRSNSGNQVQATYYDRPNINTAASIAANPCTSQPGQTAAGANPCPYYVPIPFDKKTVALRSPLTSGWFNPAMFSLPAVGQLGNAQRNLLRSPYIFTWNISAVKDTRAPWLGEKGSVQFRAEMFNPLNHVNFGQPATALFSGKLTDAGPYSEAPGSTKITTQIGTARQVQFALKAIF